MWCVVCGLWVVWGVGSIDQEEMGDYFLKLGGTKQGAARILAELDLDEDGSVQITEWLLFFKACTGMWKDDVFAAKTDAIKAVLSAN